MAGCPKHVYKRYDFPTINYSRENKSTAETKEEPCEAKCDNDDNCEGFYYVRDLCYIIRTSTSNTTTKGINKTPYFIKDRDQLTPKCYQNCKCPNGTPATCKYNQTNTINCVNCNFGFKLEKKTDGTYTCVKDVWDRTCPANEWRNNDGICERKTDHKKYCEGQHKESAVSASCTKTFSDRSEDVYFSKSAPCRFQFTPGHDNRCTYKQKGMGLVEVKYKKNADAFAEKAKYDLTFREKQIF